MFLTLYLNVNIVLIEVFAYINIIVIQLINTVAESCLYLHKDNKQQN